MTEPFVGGFSTGAAVHIMSSQIPSIFGVRNPREIHGALKLPRFYVKVISLIIQNINWVSTGVGIASAIALFIAKYLNERYKSTVRIVIPNELILVCFHFVSICVKISFRYKEKLLSPHSCNGFSIRKVVIGFHASVFWNDFKSRNYFRFRIHCFLC